jgi:hypothetical protein
LQNSDQDSRDFILLNIYFYWIFAGKNEGRMQRAWQSNSWISLFGNGFRLLTEFRRLKLAKKRQKEKVPEEKSPGTQHTSVAQ